MKNFEITKETLPGGLRVVLLPRQQRETVTFLVLIGVGSRYETPRQSGLSHFLEHMFFKGTSTRPRTQDISEAIDNVGGEFNAFTGEEYTGYYVTVAADHFDRAADVVSDILLRPLFAPEEIERERGVIIEEIRMYTGMPMSHIKNLWIKALWGEHPLGRRVDGSEATVSKFARKDFIDYVREHYHTGNAVVAVAGKFQEAKVMTALKELFAPLARGAETVPKAAPKRLPAQRFVWERRATLEQSHLIIGVPGVSLHDERRFSAALLATILGGGMSSRLFLSVRERHGLAYAVRTSADQMTDTGDLSTYAGVKVDKAKLACDLILAEYDRIMHEPVTDSELQKAKNMVYGHMMLGLEDTHGLAMYAGGEELLSKEVLSPAEIKDKFEAVTPADIQAVAEDLLDPRKRAIAYLGPQKKVDDIAALVA